MSMKWPGVVPAAVLMTCSVAAAQAVGTAAPAPPNSAQTHEVACVAQLASNSQPWVLEYSWSGGLGPGSVHLKLSSDGSAILTSTPAGGMTSDKRVTIPADAMAKLRAVLTHSPLACVHTRVRKGSVVFDLGQYMLKLTHGSTAVSAYVDECHVVDDTATFSALVDAVQGLESFVGEEIKWGPFATSSMRSDVCDTKQKTTRSGVVVEKAPQ